MKCKKIIILVAVLAFTFAISSGFSVSAKSEKTYAQSKESWNLRYSSYAQVQGAYTIPNNPGYSLDKYVGKKIKQVAIQYKRGEKAVTSRKYTKLAYSKNDYNIYSVSDSCWDSLNPWANKTNFYRWYFSF